MTSGTLYQARGVLVSPPCSWLLPGVGLRSELAAREAQSSVGAVVERPGIAWALRIWRLAGVPTPEQLETLAQLFEWAELTERWTPRVPSLGAIAFYPPAPVGIVIRLEPLVVVLPDCGILTARRVPLHDAANGYCHLQPLPRSLP